MPYPVREGRYFSPGSLVWTQSIFRFSAGTLWHVAHRQQAQAGGLLRGEWFWHPVKSRQSLPFSKQPRAYNRETMWVASTRDCASFNGIKRLP